MQEILEMITLQQELNDATNGQGWENGLTKNEKIINWKRCIYMESAELIDSFAWKHWKAIDKKADWANIRIEIVDIWHFVMSQLLQEFKLEDKGDLNTLAQHIISQEKYEMFSNLTYRPEADMHEVILMVEALMYDVLKPELFDLDAFINDFFTLSVFCGVNLETMYQLYIGKNILNRFRQDNGYKEGTYIKEWNGEEDNVVMQRLMKNSPQITTQRLYDELKEVYSSL